MTILYEYIWFAIAGAGLLGFLISWLMRGIMLAGKKRRATVERDVALTELEQVRGELDSLYAAQRKQKETAAAAMASVPVDQDANLARMSAELEAAKAELESLRAARSVAPSAEDTSVADEANANLLSRNEYLEERVGELEAKIHDMAATESAPEAGLAEAGGEDESKLEWQVDYLKMRVASLEEKLIEAGAAEAEKIEEAEAQLPQNSAADEELARLRWRNRYLEGRLAYFEEAPETTDETGPVVAEVSPAPELAPDLPADVADVKETEATSAADVPDAEDETPDEEDEHPSERMLRALGPEDEETEDVPSGGMDADSGLAETPGAESVSEVTDEDVINDEDAEEEPESEEIIEAPAGLDKPNGSADDLTLIGGIGPRIQGLLNDFGVWHFTQVAEWTSANEAWVDRELNLAGRVNREGWVRQARELAGANSALASES